MRLTLLRSLEDRLRHPSGSCEDIGLFRENLSLRTRTSYFDIRKCLYYLRFLHTSPVVIIDDVRDRVYMQLRLGVSIGEILHQTTHRKVCKEIHTSYIMCINLRDQINRQLRSRPYFFVSLTSFLPLFRLFPNTITQPLTSPVHPWETHGILTGNHD